MLLLLVVLASSVLLLLAWLVLLVLLLFLMVLVAACDVVAPKAVVSALSAVAASAAAAVLEAVVSSAAVTLVSELLAGEAEVVKCKLSPLPVEKLHPPRKYGGETVALMLPTKPGMHTQPLGTLMPVEFSGHGSASQTPLKNGLLLVAAIAPL
jgi:hypothetical protein